VRRGVRGWAAVGQERRGKHERARERESERESERKSIGRNRPSREGEGFFLFLFFLLLFLNPFYPLFVFLYIS
jgi:hypothetical protein